MAQLIVRQIEDSVKSQLRRRARRNRRSMEEEVREILRSAVGPGEDSGLGLGTEISRLFARAGLRRAIPELRGHGVKPASFDR